MIFKPFGRNIYIKPTEAKSVIINSAPSLTQYGEVIAIGDDVQKVKVGDTIGFTVFGVNHLEYDGARLYIIPETDEFILGTIMA